ncbi:(d)CMP kinase [Candidatus Babeliales bacterium]|nr:(d)CMP kinase [Candidatus Babeliales bacterium]
MIITIDGPSGAGKSTLALKIAKSLHFSYLNTGYFYRGLAYVLKTFYGYDTHRMQHPNVADIQAIFASGNLQYVYDHGIAKMLWVDDITIFLKDPEISHLAAFLGQNDIVRTQVHQAERAFVTDHDSVVEGRACGSVIFPQAEVKFFLTASLEVRAKRLQHDQQKRGNELSAQEALQHIALRDKMDVERPVEPLIKPEGAIELDSTSTNADELLEICLKFIKIAMSDKK